MNLLQEETAALLGKESALFVPTCTMANLLATLVHCPSRLSELIVGDKQHIYLYEGGGSSSLAGVHSALSDVHMPTTQMIALENTHNSCGGVPLELEYLDTVGRLSRERNIMLHIDGARLFNAAVATRTSAQRVCQSADSVSICLSKGLASPVGALIVGEKGFIRQARHLRKALGGGMRQAGVIAASGLVS